MDGCQGVQPVNSRYSQTPSGRRRRAPRSSPGPKLAVTDRTAPPAMSRGPLAGQRKISGRSPRKIPGGGVGSTGSAGSRAQTGEVMECLRSFEEILPRARPQVPDCQPLVASSLDRGDKSQQRSLPPPRDPDGFESLSSRAAVRPPRSAADDPDHGRPPLPLYPAGP